MVRTEGPEVIEKEVWFLAVKVIGRGFRRTRIPRCRSGIEALNKNFIGWAEWAGIPLEESYVTKSRGFREFDMGGVIAQYFIWFLAQKPSRG